jgi:prevent-host-death family protein
MTRRLTVKQESLWSVADAKAHLSEVIDRALTVGPQTITRHGHRAVIVVPVADWERKVERKGSLADFFNASPLRGAEITIERLRDVPREIDL